MMLLQHTFNNAELNLSLELFLRECAGLLGSDLVSVTLFGSVVYDDLCPGYGDIDFLAVMKDDPDEATLRNLVEFRQPLRSGEYGIYCHMLEGPFLPRRMLDPACTGHTVCWGTGGERHWDHNRLGWFVHRIIRERGVVIYGADTRGDLIAPTHEQMVEEARGSLTSARDNASGGDLHSVDWLLLASRLLLWLKEDRLVSKSEAADWAAMNATGAWRELLPRAKELRRRPSLAKEPEVEPWLSGLGTYILEAFDEVESELR